MKPEINLSNWGINSNRGRRTLYGLADNHPILGKNAEIRHTSLIQNMKFENETLVVETYNSIYKCELSTLSSKQPNDDLADILIEAENSPSKKDLLHKLEEYKKTSDQKSLEMRNKVIEEIKNQSEKYKNCLYVDISSLTCPAIVVYNADETTVIEPKVHIGLFQDSVLYNLDGKVDFRYIVNNFGIHIYTKEGTFDKLVIKNSLNEPIIVDDVVIDTGETVEM